MPKAFLLLLVSLATVIAQQSPNPPAQNGPVSSSAQNNPQAQPAPIAQPPKGLELGHPLDPADVDVLTGKSLTSVPAAGRTAYAAAGGYPTVYMYGGSNYSSNLPFFGNGRFHWRFDNQPFRTFGMFNPHGFLWFPLTGAPGGVFPLFNPPVIPRGRAAPH